MNLIFSSPLELVAIVAVALTVTTVTKDGEATWFEGVLLLAVYLLAVVLLLARGEAAQPSALAPAWERTVPPAQHSRRPEDRPVRPRSVEMMVWKRRRVGLLRR